jgi:RNA polymerase sigma-70 factor (ECF subfamily)
VEDQELEDLLARFQAKLSQEETLLYRLRFNEGLAQESAAARMGLTRIQLRRRELAVKKRLLAYLHRHGYLTELTPGAWSFVRTKGET